MTNPDPAADKSLGALAIKVAGLERRTAAAEKAARVAMEQAAKAANLDADLRALRDQLAEIPNDIEERLDRLTEQIAALALGDSTESGPASWFDVTDAEVATVMLRELSEWVTEVVRRYPESRLIGECWMHHPELVEQLLVLRALWLRAYRNPDGKLDQAADWQQRWWPDFVNRNTARSCGGFGTGEHKKDKNKHILAADAAALRQAAVYAEWWTANVAGRPAGEEPLP